MPATKYLCTNFANCDAALSKSVIEIEEGEEAVCPTCKGAKTLVPAGNGGSTGGGRSKRPLVIGAAAVLAILLVWVLWPSGPNPDLATSMMTDFFPRLK
jgi:hypothetical protein